MDVGCIEVSQTASGFWWAYSFWSLLDTFVFYGSQRTRAASADMMAVEAVC